MSRKLLLAAGALALVGCNSGTHATLYVPKGGQQQALTLSKVESCKVTTDGDEVSLDCWPGSKTLQLALFNPGAPLYQVRDDTADRAAAEKVAGEAPHPVPTVAHATPTPKPKH